MAVNPSNGHQPGTAALYRFVSAVIVLVVLGAAYVYVPMDQPLKTIVLGLIGAAVLAVEEYWKNQ